MGIVLTFVRYIDWLNALLQGNLGTSLQNHLPVTDRILAVLPNTLLLTSTARVPSMPDPGRLAAFGLLSFVIIVVPGPSVLFVISRGVVLGRRAALMTVLGNEAGLRRQGHRA